MRLRWSFILTALLVLAIPAAGASLSPMSYGLPTMVQSLNTVAFNNVVGNAWDIESMDFSPLGTSTGFGTFGCPIISQNGLTGQAIEATEFSQTTQFTGFSYPMVTTGLTGFEGFNLMG
jgi:hypothetical protein